MLDNCARFRECRDPWNDAHTIWPLPCNQCLSPSSAEQVERISLVHVVFSDHIHLRGIHDRHRLEIEHSLPFGFDCFRKPRRKMVPRYFVSVPSAEIEFSMQGLRLTRSKVFRVPYFPRRRSFVSPPLPFRLSSFFLLVSVSIVRGGRAASSSGGLPKVMLTKSRFALQLKCTPCSLVSVPSPIAQKHQFFNDIVISDFVDEMSLSLMTEAKKIMSKYKTITRIFIFKCKYVENALTCARSERLHGLRGPFPCA